MQSPVEAGLARDGGVSGAESIAAIPLSQASQLPQLICVHPGVQASSHRGAVFDPEMHSRQLKSPSVGAGLARDSGVSGAESIAAIPQSQASQLPHSSFIRSGV